MPFYVAPEQVMKDRAEYAQKGIARGRSLVATIYDDGVAHRGREPVALAAQDQRDLRPHRLRRRRQVQRVRPAPRGRRPPRRHQGLRLQPRGRRRPVAGQPLRPVPRQRLHPRDEAARGRDPGGRARATARPDQLYHIAYEGTITDEDRFAVLGRRRRGDRRAGRRRRWQADWDLRERPSRRADGGAGRPGPDARRRGPRGGHPEPRQRPPHLPAAIDEDASWPRTASA